MSTKQDEEREGLEKWLDERIRLAISRLPNPFEKRIALLRERIEKVHNRLNQVLDNLERESEPESPGNE